MIKVLKTNRLNVVEKSIKNPVSIMARQKNKLIVFNLDHNAKVDFDAKNDQVTITFSLQDGECVYLGEKDGIKKREILEDRRA